MILVGICLTSFFLVRFFQVTAFYIVITLTIMIAF